MKSIGRNVGNRGLKLGVAAAMSLIFLAGAASASAQSCTPSAQAANPAPSGQASLARIAGDFRLHESQIRTVRLEAGKSYWVSAAGCPRMGRIALGMKDAGNEEQKADQGYSPAFCFTAPESGEYKFAGQANSLTGSNSWGSISASLTPSRCGGG